MSQAPSLLQLVAAVYLVTVIATATASAEAAKEPAWIPLFNGKNLDGWYTYLDGPGENSDPDHVFQINDGVIHLYKDLADGETGAKGYFAKNADYSYYHLRFEYKFGIKKFKPRYEQKRDAGLLYHVAGPDVVWPRCFECQVQEGDTGDCLAVQGTRLEATVVPKLVDRESYQCRDADAGGIPTMLGGLHNVRFIKEGAHDTEGWNKVELIVHGDEEATQIVNGHQVFHGKKLGRLGRDNKTWEHASSGRIAFQAECAEVFYRNIEIRPIAGGPLKASADESATAVSVAAVVGAAVPNVAPAIASPASLPTVPEGFEITLAAGPPLVDYPTLACFDDQGRLYVSEGANVNDVHSVVEKTLPRSIRRLEDTDGDGVFDRSTVFADKMTFPYGGVFHNGALYVAADPTLWRLEDTDDDGVADNREVVITGFHAEGHSACMKGGYLGRDGWMYFCGGNEGPYDLVDKNGTRLNEPRTAPCVFRIRPDGTDLEYICNGAAGVYDLTFDPSGDLFGVVTILRYPRGDGLMHWVYGGKFQSSCVPSKYARATGDVLPELHEWAQSSPSGTVQYESGAFGNDYRGNIFTAHFGSRTVTRDAVERKGATWRVTQEENFAQTDNLNCRFTDVLEDADGSLLLVNTGGWFRIGCPTATVGDGDLRGAIYRVRKKGQRSVTDPRGLKIAWNTNSDTELAKLLGDCRFTVREHAIAEFARRGKATAPTLRTALQSPSAETRRNAVWALTRIDDADARAGVRDSLSDGEPTNVVAALHSIGNWRDAKAFDRLIELLKSNEPSVRREAATALGRLGNPACVPALLEPLASTSDRFMEQALIFAMIEIDNSELVRAGLNNANPNVQRGALMALDQMNHGNLKEDDVAQFLESEKLALQKTALDVVSHHKGWTKGLLKYFTKQLVQPSLAEEQSKLILAALRGATADRAIQRLVASVLNDENTPTATRLLLLDVINFGKSKQLPPAWRQPLETCLQSKDETLARAAIDAAAHFSGGGFTTHLDSLALDANRPMPVRIEAANAAVSSSLAPVSDRLFQFLVERCASNETEIVGRLTLAQALGNAHLSPTQLMQLIPSIAAAGPLELPSLLKAFEDSPEPIAGKELFAALEKSPGISSLSVGRVQHLIERYPKPLHAAAEPVLNKFGAATESQAARLKELEFVLSGGDPVRGHNLFIGKAACSQCHRVNKSGANVGPELTSIGDIRTRRDLIESIAFPSATFARGFEPVTVIASGRPYTGILRDESPKEVTLLTPGRSETTIPRDEIEEIVPSQVSIMPQGLDRNLTPDELRDVVAFLSSLKSNKEP